MEKELNFHKRNNTSRKKNLKKMHSKKKLMI